MPQGSHLPRSKHAQSRGWPCRGNPALRICNSLDRRGWEQGARITECFPSLEPRVKFLKCWRQIFLGRRPRALIWLLGEIRECRDLTKQHKTLPLHQLPHNKPTKTKNSNTSSCRGNWECSLGNDLRAPRDLQGYLEIQGCLLKIQRS